MTPSPLRSLGLPEALTQRLLADGLYTPGHLVTLIDDYPEATMAIAGVSAAELEQIIERCSGPLQRVHLHHLGAAPARPVAGLVAQADAPGPATARLHAGPGDADLAAWLDRIGPLPVSHSLAPGLPDVGDQGHHPFCAGFAASVPHEQRIGATLSAGYAYRGAKARDGQPEVDGTRLIDAMRHLFDTGTVDEARYSYADAVAQRPIAPLRDIARRLRSDGFCSLLPGVGATLDHVPRILKAALSGRLHPDLPGLAVPFGMRMFDSFRSVTTARTGLVNAPLPSERALGGHAMAVTGYFDADARENPFGIGLFEVRNSYSARWAALNPMGRPGYALIPETLFTRADLLWEAYLCIAPPAPRPR